MKSILTDANATQRMLILSMIDLNIKDGMFETMCREIKLVLGGGQGKAHKTADDAISMEPIKEENEVFVVFNGNKYFRGGYKGRGKGHGKPYERNSDQVREKEKG